MAAAIATVGAIYGYRGDEDKAAEWFTFATGIAPDIGGQLDGMQLLRADVDLHHGRVDAAAERLQAKKVSFWWRALYLATRAEAFARAGLSGAEEAVGLAQETIGDHAAAGGILLRARGLLAQDESLLADSLAVFEGIGCPYQAARSGWLMDGDPRGQAEAAFAKLGAPLPG
jgi:hypothetical protein